MDIRHAVLCGIIVLGFQCSAIAAPQAKLPRAKPAATNEVIDMLMPKPHPLDVQMEKETAPYSPSGLTAEIYRNYEQRWDAELNRVYQQWLKTVSAKEQQVLRESQRAWLKFRDAQKKLLDDVYFPTGHAAPTMEVSFHAYAVMNLTRERAIELIRRLEARRQLRAEWEELERLPSEAGVQRRSPAAKSTEKTNRPINPVPKPN